MKCQAADWCIPAPSGSGPKQALLLLFLQRSLSCGSSAEHLIRLGWGVLLTCQPPHQASGSSKWWSIQGRCPTSIKTSARTQGPASVSQWASCWKCGFLISCLLWCLVHTLNTFLVTVTALRPFLGFDRDISASSSQLNNPKDLVHLCLRDQISLSNFLGILLGCLGVNVMWL